MSSHRSMSFWIIAMVFTLVSNTAVAQIPEIDWQRTYGGSSWDIPYSMLDTPSDSGFIVAGVTESTDGDITDNEGIWDYWVVKLDSIGGIIWQKTYGGSSIDQCNDIIATEDGGYLLVGFTYSNDGDITYSHGSVDYWIIKINSNGELEWEKTYGGSKGDFGRKAIMLPTGNFVIIGNSKSSDGDISMHHGGLDDSEDIWVVEINTFGDLIWEHSYGSSDVEIASDIILDIDALVVSGFTYGGSDGDIESSDGASDYWVFKINLLGEIIWESTFGGDDYDYAESVGLLSNGDFFVCGSTASIDGDITDFHGGIMDVFTVIIDSLGNLKSSFCYGGSNYDSSYDLNIVDSNSILISGSSSSNDGDLSENKGDTDFWVIMVDSIGAIKWQKSLGGALDEYAYCQTLTEELNSYVVAGRTHSSDGDLDFNHGNYDYWVVKLNVCEKIFYSDYDGDGFGNINNDSIACDIPIGYVVDSTDCNDSLNFINPNAKEICNYFDDDCDGFIDEGLTYIYSFEDFDNDNYGNELVDSLSCALPIGYVLDNTDCDDNNPEIYPGAIEILNGLDDDCDQIADEGLSINDPTTKALSLHPNPTYSSIQINAIFNEVGTYTIYSSTGQLAMFGIWNSAEQIISVSTIAPGVYSIQLKASDSISSGFFVKL